MYIPRTEQVDTRKSASYAMSCHALQGTQRYADTSLPKNTQLEISAPAFDPSVYLHRVGLELGLDLRLSLAPDPSKPVQESLWNDVHALTRVYYLIEVRPSERVPAVHCCKQPLQIVPPLQVARVESVLQLSQDVLALVNGQIEGYCSFVISISPDRPQVSTQMNLLFRTLLHALKISRTLN